jgi:hypothetical protein
MMARHDEFVALLDRARTDADAGVDVRKRLREAGVLTPCTLYIEIIARAPRRSMPPTRGNRHACGCGGSSR